MVNSDIARIYRVSKFVKLVGKIEKLKFIGSIQQIITAFLEFLS